MEGRVDVDRIRDRIDGEKIPRGHGSQTEGIGGDGTVTGHGLESRSERCLR